MYIRLTPASNRCIALLYLRKFKLQDLLRRTRGTDLYQQGIAIELVARHLGHSCLDTTRTYYAKPSLEMLSTALTSASSFESEEK